MPLQPLGGDVVVIPIDDPNKIGSLFVPDSAKKNHDQGIVIWKGPDVTDLKAGDHVMFNAYSGNKVAIAGEGDFVIIPESHIVAVYHPSEPDGIITLSMVKQNVDLLLNELPTRSPVWSKEILDGYRRGLGDLVDRLVALITSGGWEF